MELLGRENDEGVASLAERRRPGVREWPTCPSGQRPAAPFVPTLWSAVVAERGINARLGRNRSLSCGGPLTVQNQQPRQHVIGGDRRRPAIGSGHPRTFGLAALIVEGSESSPAQCGSRRRILRYQAIRKPGHDLGHRDHQLRRVQPVITRRNQLLRRLRNSLRRRVRCACSRAIWR
jgi:hypothetical protein